MKRIVLIRTEVKKMKVKSLLNKAKKELNSDKEKVLISSIKKSLKNISDCKRTLKQLEVNHKKLLDSDIEDIELDDYEW